MKKPTGNDLAEIIRKAGFRATKPRLLVLSFLQKVEYPVGIKEIIAGVGRKNVDQVTIYRMLESFMKAGIVVKVDFQHGRAYYELKDAKHDHHHIICTGCDRIEDFTGCDYGKLADKALSQTSGFAKVTNHAVELFGLCNTCVKTA